MTTRHRQPFKLTSIFKWLKDRAILLLVSATSWQFFSSKTLFNYMPVLITAAYALKSWLSQQIALDPTGIIPANYQPYDELWKFYAAILFGVCIMVKGIFLKTYYNNADRPYVRQIILVLMYLFGGWCASLSFDEALTPIVITLTVFIISSLRNGDIEYEDIHLAGRKITDYFTLNRQIRNSLNRDAARNIAIKTLLFAGNPVRTTDAALGFLLIGSPGSGKSTLMNSLFVGLKTTGGIIYDFQKQMFSKLTAHGINPDRFVFLNPFEERGSQWLMPLDLTNWDRCYEATAAFFPESKGKSDDFWQEAPRLIMTVVMMTLNRKAKDAGVEPRWELRDLVNIMRDKRILFPFLKTYDDLYANVSSLDSENDSSASIMMTITAKMAKFQSIAQAWHEHGKQGRNISLGDVPTSRKIYFLGREEVRGKEQLATLNAVIMDFINKVFLDRQTDDATPDAQFYVFIDELAALGMIPSLPQIAVEGRKLGVSLVLAFQSYPMIEKLYGKEAIASIVGVIKFICFLQTDEPETQQWAAKIIGKHRILRPSQSKSRQRTSIFDRTKDSITQSVSYTKMVDDLFIDSEFGALNHASTGVMSAIVKYKNDVYRWNERVGKLYKFLPQQHPSHKQFNYLPLPEYLSELKPLANEDFERLNFDPADFTNGQSSDSVDDDTNFDDPDYKNIIP